MCVRYTLEKGMAMLDCLKGRISLYEKMRMATYQTLYDNVRNRLFLHEEVLATDFFTTRHLGEESFIKKHRDRPTAYKCNSKSVYTGNNTGECVYLVIAGIEKVVLLLTLKDAVTRNLPFLAVLENGLFRPYLGCIPTYWQTHIEPDSISRTTVLPTTAVSSV